MIRTIIRNKSVWFGPLQDRQLNVISQDPVFAGHGIRASAGAGEVQVYVTLPADPKRLNRVQDWFLRNHKILA